MAGWILESIDPAVVLRMPAGAVKTIGRTARADFILDAPLVSRVHCRLTTDTQDQLLVEDLDSTNGTLVNGEPIKRSILRTGDAVTVGRVTFNVSTA